MNTQVNTCLYVALGEIIVFVAPRCRSKWIVGHIRSHLVHISVLLGCSIGVYLSGEAHEPDPQINHTDVCFIM